jgi:hypothetical protein
MELEVSKLAKHGVSLQASLFIFGLTKTTRPLPFLYHPNGKI